VLACDIDAEACRIACENATLNAVGDLVEVTLEPLAALTGEFDLVLANILAEENIRLAAELVGRVAPAGALILSGILQEKEALVVEAFAAFPLKGPEITRREEWSCLLYRKER
jgi:ribosomal protein L11 methyltransferase